MYSRNMIIQNCYPYPPLYQLHLMYPNTNIIEKKGFPLVSFYLILKNFHFQIHVSPTLLMQFNKIK